MKKKMTAAIFLALAAFTTINLPPPTDIPLCVAPKMDAPLCVGHNCMEVK